MISMRATPAARSSALISRVRSSPNVVFSTTEWPYADSD